VLNRHAAADLSLVRAPGEADRRPVEVAQSGPRPDLACYSGAVRLSVRLFMRLSVPLASSVE
jgi:hypothetical protein